MWDRYVEGKRPSHASWAIAEQKRALRARVERFIRFAEAEGRADATFIKDMRDLCGYIGD